MRRSFRTTVALTGVTVLLLAGCGDDPTVEVEPTEDPEVTEEPEEPEETEPDEEPAPDDDGTAAPDDDGTAAPDDDGTAADGSGDGDTVDPPTPDPTLVDDPCSEDQERADEAFITVVSPVADQHVSADTVELVGCSNVFEANVQWSVYDGDGRELETGFTTAECGNGCVGAYRDEVPLDAFEDEPYAELHVYSEDAAGEQGRMFLVAVPLVLS